jgi:hypothetical protein
MTISKLLAFKHSSTCSDDLNIPDSTNISGNLDLAWKYLKLEPKSVCRIPTYVDLMKCNKSYARHPQIYKDAANSADGNFISCKPSIQYSCCSHWSAKKTKYCLSNTVCRIFCAKLGSGKAKTNQNICSKTQSQSLCSTRQWFVSNMETRLDQVFLNTDIRKGTPSQVAGKINRVSKKYWNLHYQNCYWN